MTHGTEAAKAELIVAHEFICAEGEDLAHLSTRAEQEILFADREVGQALALLSICVCKREDLDEALATVRRAIRRVETSEEPGVLTGLITAQT